MVYGLFGAVCVDFTLIDRNVAEPTTVSASFSEVKRNVHNVHVMVNTNS